MESGRKRTREQADQQTSALDLARIRAAEYERLRPERERQEAQRQLELEALYPGYESGDTGNSEWAYRRDTQRFMVAWVGDRPRWPGWLPEAGRLPSAWAIPKSRRSPEQYSEGRAEWLLRRQRGEERCEAGRVRKRARQEDPQGPEALAARRPIIRALDVLREREERQELELGRTRTASKGGATQSQQEASQDEGDAAPVTKGAKRKRTAATKREQKKKQATEALAWDSPERPASRPLLTQEGECPPEAYKPADPMDVG